MAIVYLEREEREFLCVRTRCKPVRVDEHRAISRDKMDNKKGWFKFGSSYLKFEKRCILFWPMPGI